MFCGRGILRAVVVSGGQQAEEQVQGPVQRACISEGDNTGLPQAAEVALEVEVGRKEER